MPIKIRTQDKVVAGILFGFTGVACAIGTFIPSVERPIDAERSSYLQTQFGDAIAQAVNNIDTPIISIPSAAADSGAILSTYAAEGATIQTARLDGDYSTELRTREAENNTLLQQAESLFVSEGGSASFIGVQCSKSLRNNDPALNCDLVVAEMGGVNDSINGVTACTSMAYEFNATINEDGSISVANYYAPTTRSLDMIAEQFNGTSETHPYTYLEHANPGFRSISTLDETQLNAGQALLTFGKCLPTVN